MSKKSKDSGTNDFWYAQLKVMKKVWLNDADNIWDEAQLSLSKERKWEK